MSSVKEQGISHSIQKQSYFLGLPTGLQSPLYTSEHCSLENENECVFAPIALQ